MTQDTMASKVTENLGEMKDSDLALLRGAAVPGHPQDLYAIFSQAAHQYSERPALVSLYQSDRLLPSVNSSCQAENRHELRWTYAQLLNGANCLAASLYSQGVRAGDSFAVFLENSAESALLLWAAARLRARFVPLDPRSLSRSKEVEHYLGVVQPHVVVVRDEPSAQIVDSKLSTQSHATVKITVRQGDTTPPIKGWQIFEDLVVSSREALLQLLCMEQQAPDLKSDIGLVVFTSGTTGSPKACPHTYRSIWHATGTFVYFRKAKSSHVLLHHLPISHVFGIMNLIAFWRVGASIVLPSERFDAKSSMEALHKENITHMPCVPSIIHALLEHVPDQRIQFKPLENVHLGAAIIPPAMLETCTNPAKFGAKFATVGLGLSEGLSIFGWVNGETVVVESDVVSVGRIAQGGLAKICAPESRQILRRGETGELHIGGPMVINGYLNTDSDMFYRDEEGVDWFVTGDQAKIDNSGAAYILGRYKDIIIRAGENISPNTIESCLGKLSGIMESQVVGIRDEFAGEVPVAVIRVRDDCGLTHSEMNDFVKSELGLASMPVRILTLQDLGLSALPLTTSGKVRKVELKNIVQDHIIKSQPVFQVSTTQRYAASEALLKNVWSRLLGLPMDEVPLDRPIMYLADSIIALQFRSVMKREYGLDVHLDSSDEMTIRSQASSISTKEIGARHIVSSSGRNGPPIAEDMVHTFGEENGLARTIQAAQSVLNEMKLDWDRDVEDVFPVPDAYKMFFRNTRPNAWNLRLTMVASDIDVQMLRHALEISLSRWPLMRALQVNYDGTVPLYLVIRSESRQLIDRCIERKHLEVTTAEELETFNLPVPSYARPPGPLFRAVLATIKDTTAVGVILQIHHSIFDATSIEAWRDDFHNILYSKDESRSHEQTSFKLFADTSYLYCNSPLAAASTAFHVKRARGISKLREGIWPKQRACKWFIGSDKGWLIPSEITKDVPSIRTPLNPDRTLGAIGINRIVSLPHIARIKADHGIAASMVLKTACTLFNICVTGQQTIIFGNIQASRAWPFLPEWISRELPNPIDIQGPTFESIPAIINVSERSESVLSLMKRVDLDQSECSKWPHVPVLIQRELGEDRTVYNECRIRQTFNWIHTWRGGREQASEGRKTKVLQSERMFDMGVFWNCGMINADTLRMSAQYDDCQLRNEEMNEATDCFLAIAEWIHRPENWERSVADCLADRNDHSSSVVSRQVASSSSSD